MDRRQLVMLTLASAVGGLGPQAVLAEDEESSPALIKAMGAAKVTLQDGLTTASQQGQPISAKFELEDGKLQLSVYTAKDGKFSEVIVDYASGKVAKSEPITEGEDLAAAKAQNAAMAKAKTDLKAALDKAAAQSAGSRGVSITPSLQNGRPIASVTLLVGQRLKSFGQSLE